MTTSSASSATSDPSGPANDRYARGLAALRQLTGSERPAALDVVSEIAPDLVRFTVEFGYGDIWSRPGLTPRQRQIATIAALAALGNAAPQLRVHIDGALNVGVTHREIVEIFIHAAVYAGFPAALNALTVAHAVFTERPAPAEPAALDGAPGASAPVTPDERHARALDMLRAVDGPPGVHIVEALNAVAPDLGTVLVDFVFGDVYTRTGLDLAARELASIAMCTALGTAGPQLRVHLRGFLNVGGTREEILELMIQMAGYVGFPATLNGITAAQEIFAESADTA